MPADQDDQLAESAPESRAAPESEEANFAQIVLDNLRMAGVQQAHKEDRITFSALTGWPGEYICAEARYMEGEKERRAGIFIGPEFGTVARPDLVADVLPLIGSACFSSLRERSSARTFSTVARSSSSPGK